MQAEHDVSTQKTILVLSNGLPHPTKGASVVLLWHYVLALVNAGWTVRHLVLDHGELTPADLAEYTEHLDGRATAEAVRVPPVFRELKTRVACDVDQAVAKARQMAEGCEAVFAFDIPAAAVAAELTGLKRVVWLGDLLFDVRIYHNLYAVRERWRTIAHLPISLAVYRSWRAHYRSILAGFDMVIASSGSSVAKLASLGIEAAYWPYPWPSRRALALADAPSTADGPAGGVPTFAFFGSLGGLGSRSAFHFMFKRLVPALRQRWGAGSFRIVICGTSSLPGWVVPLVDASEEAEFLGFVDDLDALLATVTGIIAPLDVPVGNRSRIVTAMAAGCPVISHRNAALGNPDLEDDVNCFLADDVDEFAAAMARLAADPAVRRRLAVAALTTYGRTFAPEVAGPRLAQALEEFAKS